MSHTTASGTTTNASATSPYWAAYAGRRLDIARRALGPDRFEAAWSEGYVMSLGEAICRSAEPQRVVGCSWHSALMVGGTRCVETA